MGYRDPSPPEPITIPYGRFRLVRSEVFFFLLAFVFGGGALIGATHRTAFHCERTEGHVRCEERSSLLWQSTRVRTFEGEQLSSVEWRSYTGERSREMGRTDLFDSVGRPASVLRGSRDEARADHRAFRRFLDDEGRASLALEEENGLWIGLTIGLLCWIWAFSIIRSLVRTSGRLEVLVDVARDAIVLRARRFGIFRTERVHPLGGLVGLAVEHTHIKRTSHGRGSPGEPAGKLRLDYVDGPPRELTSAALPGSDVHEDLAERLREATGLEPESRAVVVGDAENDAPGAQASKKRRGWALYLTIGIPLGAMMLAFGLQALVDTEAGGGRLHIRAERRCKLQGTELLPGGEMGMVLAPGTYTVEVYDPEVPGTWRTDTLEVREGRALDYVCR